jgi:hypothetical protein
MAKELAPKAAAEIQESTPLAEIVKLPDTIQLQGHSFQVLEEICVHARQGYHLFPGVNPHHGFNGMMAVLLQRGEPLALAAQRAAESMAEAQRKEAIEFDRRVTAEAKRLQAEKAQADLEAQVAAAQAVADAQVAKIRADAEAAIARITATV